MDDMNGTKTMAQKEGSVNPTIEVSKDIPTNELEQRLGADAYADFPASSVKSYETYSARAGKLEEALGNRDSVKG